MAIRVIPEKQPNDSSGFDRPEIAFELRPGKKGHSGALPTWRFLASSREIGAAIAEFYGGTPDDDEGSARFPTEVITGATELEVVLDGNTAIYDHLIQWGTPGQPPIHDCDGQVSNLEANRGEPCGCPADWDQIKDRAKKSIGPKPVVEITFRLAHDYELGTGKLLAGGVVLAEDLYKVRNALDKVDGEALVVLRKEEVKTKSHDFIKTVIEVKGSYNDAIAQAA